MLDQVVIPGTFPSGNPRDSAHRVELVVAREDQCLLDDAPLPAVAVIDLFIAPFDKHEVTEDVEEAVALEDLFPEIAGAVAGGMLRVACAALDLARMAATVERQEDGSLP